MRVDPTTVYHDLSRSAITSGEPSWSTRNVLREHGLLESFKERPEVTLADLHRSMVAAGGDVDALFALAELSFLHARASGERAYHLAAAVYAWAIVRPSSHSTQGNPHTIEEVRRILRLHAERERSATASPVPTGAAAEALAATP